MFSHSKSKSSTKAVDIISTKRGGPRSFYKFIYRNKEIIIIGHSHTRMTAYSSDQYITVLNSFIQNNLPITMFVESDSYQKSISDPLASGLNFIDCISQLNKTENLKLICSNKYDFSHQGFINLFLFLDKIALIEKNIMSKWKVNNGKTNLSATLFRDAQTLDAISKLGDEYSEKFEFINLYEFMSNQIVKLNRIAFKHSHDNPEIYDYLCHCIADINNSLRILIEIENEYRNMNFADKDIHNQNFISVCSSMIIQSGSFDVTKKISNIISAYCQYYLDALLVSDLCEHIQYTFDKEVVMLVIDEDYTPRLVELFKSIAIKYTLIEAGQRGAIIESDMLKNLLHDDLAPEASAESESRCLMM